MPSGLRVQIPPLSPKRNFMAIWTSRKDREESKYSRGGSVAVVRYRMEIPGIYATIVEFKKSAEVEAGCSITVDSWHEWHTDMPIKDAKLLAEAQVKATLEKQMTALTQKA